LSLLLLRLLLEITLLGEKRSHGIHGGNAKLDANRFKAVRGCAELAIEPS